MSAMLISCIYRESEEQEILTLEERSSNTAFLSLRCTEPPEIVLNANSDSVGQARGLRVCISLKFPGATDAADLWPTYSVSHKGLRDLHCPIGCPPDPCGPEHQDRGQSQLRWGKHVKSAPDFQGWAEKRNAKCRVNHFILVICWNNSIGDILG